MTPVRGDDIMAIIFVALAGFLAVLTLAQGYRTRRDPRASREVLRAAAAAAILGLSAFSVVRIATDPGPSVFLLYGSGLIFGTFALWVAWSTRPKA